MAIKNITQAERANGLINRADESLMNTWEGSAIARATDTQSASLQDRRVGYGQSNLNISKRTPVNRVKNSSNSDNSLTTAVYSATDGIMNRISVLGKYDAQTVSTGDTVEKVDSMTSSADVDATYVESDPVQPKETPKIVSPEPTVSATPNNQIEYIDTMQNDYSVNNELIPSSDIIGTTSDGIIVQKQSADLDQLSSYTYYPSDDLQMQTKPTTSEYNNFTQPTYHSSVSGAQDSFNHLTVDATAPTEEVQRFTYKFGFNDIRLERRELVQVAAYMSAPILVKGTQYIMLSAPIIDGVEYSVIDGDKEIPILPIGQESVKGEKLFYGLMPRFTIVDSTSISVYKNLDEVMNITSREDLELFLAANNTNEEVSQSNFSATDLYTIDYTPDSDSQQYMPKNNYIQLKIIQRYYGKLVPEAIRNILIRKYGIKTTWYLSSFDETGHYNPDDIRR